MNRNRIMHLLISKIRIFIVLFLLSFISFIALSCSESSSTPDDNIPSGFELIDSFENGALYRTTGNGGGGKFNVIVLDGNWNEMGRQYGYLLKNEMNEFYEIVVTDYLIGTLGNSYEEIVEAAEDIYAQQFSYMQELIEGMAESSGEPLEKMVIISTLIHLIGLPGGCSSLSAWNDYTGGGPLVVGRNWDMGPPFSEYGRFMTVVVYKPNSSLNAIADINFVGTISLQTGMNSSGIFLDIQNGQHSDTIVVPDRKLPTFVLCDFLLNSTTIEEIDGYMFDHDNLPQLSLIINAANSNEDRVYEWATYDVKCRTGNGLIASSNHFIDSTWTNLPDVQDSALGDYSIERLANLLALGEEYKANINATVMQQIFDTEFSAGGPTFSEYTIYQVVAVPAQQTIWVKTPVYSGWEKIELGQLFAGSR